MLRRTATMPYGLFQTRTSAPSKPRASTSLIRNPTLLARSYRSTMLLRLKRNTSARAKSRGSAVAAFISLAPGGPPPVQPVVRQAAFDLRRKVDHHLPCAGHEQRYRPIALQEAYFPITAR